MCKPQDSSHSWVAALLQSSQWTQQCLLASLQVAYPSYFGAAQVAGLQVHYMPLGADLLPAFDKVDAATAARCKLLLLNYPSNPTSAVASEEFFQRALAFCETHDLLVVHDNPYVDLVGGWGRLGSAGLLRAAAAAAGWCCRQVWALAV
jgi:histidinol-phosphate/aromatic aminotransferase/cobyric acid decarboxylase-like protein